MITTYYNLVWSSDQGVSDELDLFSNPPTLNGNGCISLDIFG